MTIIDIGENLHDKIAKFLEIHNNTVKRLLKKVLDNFREWCGTLDNAEKIKDLLWGINRTIEPFSHKIEGKFPDFTAGKDLNQKGYGIDGLLEIKHKARRIKKEDLIEYIARNDYLKYIEYCMKKVNDSDKVTKTLRYLKRLNKLIEVDVLKKEIVNKNSKEINRKCIKLCKLYSDEIFDKILTFLVDISLEWLSKLLSISRMPVTDSENPEKFQIDLHLHSHYSDCGAQSVGEVLCKAKEIGLKTISITDHNNFDGVCKAIEIGSIFNIDVIPGIEVATGVNKNNKWIEDRRDILVYYPNLDEFQKWALNGFDSYTNALLEKAIDRIHNKILWGNVPVDTVLEWAIDHGGVSILAHPGYYNYETYENIIGLLNKGLKGIELFNLKYTNYSHYAKNSLEEVIELFFNMIKKFTKYSASKRKLIFTIGSDSHSLDTVGIIILSSELVFKIISFYNYSEPAINIITNQYRWFEQLIFKFLKNSILV